MQDITMYSDNELSLQVFNDEYFYIERHNLDYVLALCYEEFIFTDEQLNVLKQDIKDDLEEEQ